MTPEDRYRISIASARYLEALEASDNMSLQSLWETAAMDANLLAAFRDIHAGLIEERGDQSTDKIAARVSTLADEHLGGADIVRPVVGPVTIAEVADELFRNPPDRLSVAGHQTNERLRTVRDEFPLHLGLSNFIAWAEQKYGTAQVAYWKTLREIAVKLELRRGADVEYQLAARRAAKPEGESR
jgi:hypothetical protein